MSQLTVRRGPQPGKVYELHDDLVNIGSGAKNHVVIMDNDVSREHCRLVRRNHDYEVQDLESQRGTFVGGQRIRQGWLLKSGSIIELGENVTLEYQREATSRLDSPDPDHPPYLVMTRGYSQGRAIALTKPSLTIGRDMSNEISIPEAESSRFHVRLQWNGETYSAEDLDSTNGTLVNGVQIPPNSPILLHQNDMLRIASVVEFRYTTRPEEIAVRARKDAGIITARTSMVNSNPAALLSGATITDTNPNTALGTGLNPSSLSDHLLIAYTRDLWEPLVAALTLELQDQGFPVWVDQYLTLGSRDWMAAVRQALSECWMVIPVISMESAQSGYMQMMYRYFLNREKPIIALLYSELATLPLDLAKKKSVRFNIKEVEQSFSTLIDELRRLEKPNAG